jgi:hypothetical protein
MCPKEKRHIRNTQRETMKASNPGSMLLMSSRRATRATAVRACARELTAAARGSGTAGGFQSFPCLGRFAASLYPFPYPKGSW